MPKQWPRLRKLADHLREIADEGANDLDKSADEVESEMEVYLLGELGPLLESAQASTEINSGATRFNLEQELKKWK